MKRIPLDRKDKKIREFVQTLSAGTASSILELGGKPVLKVVPLAKGGVDRAKLRAAIAKRRDESRKLNRDWQHVDQEMWDRIPGSEE
jgi:hypothetical protein